MFIATITREMYPRLSEMIGNAISFYDKQLADNESETIQRGSKLKGIASLPWYKRVWVQTGIDDCEEDLLYEDALSLTRGRMYFYELQEVILLNPASITLDQEHIWQLLEYSKLGEELSNEEK